MIQLRKKFCFSSFLASKILTMDPEIPMKITDLNEYCLSEIFKNLDFVDVLNVKNAMLAFGDAVDSVVKVKEFKFEIRSFDRRIYTKQIHNIDKFLQKFGDKLQYLNFTILPSPYAKAINYHCQPIITEFCNSGNIRHCLLHGFEFGKEFLEDNRRLFTSLESLNIEFSESQEDYGRSEKIKFLMEMICTTKIKSIFIQTNGHPIKFNVFPYIIMSQLEACHIYQQYGEDIYYDLDTIEYIGQDLSKNSKLEELSLRDYPFDSAYLTHFPNIRELELTVYSDNLNLDPIADLSMLENIGLSFDEYYLETISRIIRKLAQTNKLTKFRCYGNINTPNDYDGDSLAMAVCELTNLKTLILKIPVLLGSHLPQIAEKMPNLSHFFHPIARDIIDIDHHLSTVVDFIRAAKKLSRFIYFCHVVIMDTEKIQQFYESIVNTRREHTSDYVPGRLKLVLSSDEDIKQSDDDSKYVKLTNANKRE